jgi:hypothetical protein
MYEEQYIQAILECHMFYILLIMGISHFIIITLSLPPFVVSLNSHINCTEKGLGD